MNIVVLSETSIIDRLSASVASTADNIAYYPLIEILPININNKKVIDCVHSANKIIFQSKNSVRCSQMIWDCVAKHNKLTCFAVGKATATTVREKIGVDCLSPEKIYSSESLLNMEELRNVEDDKIVILKGKDGRNLISDTLIERGAELESIDVYERKSKDLELNQISLDAVLFNYIIVLSRFALEVFLNKFKDRLDSYKLVFIVPNTRVVKSLSLGKSSIYIVVNEINNEAAYLKSIQEHQASISLMN